MFEIQSKRSLYIEYETVPAMRPCFLDIKFSYGKMKDFNDQNTIFITTRPLYFKKKTKKFFSLQAQGEGDFDRARPWVASPKPLTGKFFLEGSRHRDEEVSAAQNFVDIMVKIHNKIRNIKSPTPTGAPPFPVENYAGKRIAFCCGCLRVSENHLSFQNLGKMEWGIWVMFYFGCLIFFECAGHEKF